MTKWVVGEEAKPLNLKKVFIVKTQKELMKFNMS